MNRPVKAVLHSLLSPTVVNGGWFLWRNDEEAHPRTYLHPDAGSGIMP